MEYGICTLTIIPLRKEASHQSEMVSQLLFGDLFFILEKSAGWIKIKTYFEDYEGWLQAGQFQLLSEHDKAEYLSLEKQVAGLKGGVISADGHQFEVLHGSVLYLNSANQFRINHVIYHFDGDINPYQEKDFEWNVQQLAQQYLDAPYLWGGKSRFGIDCSGFSQLIYKCFEIDLPRDAYQQAEEGFIVDFLPEIKPGDLAFFDNDEGRITHVGIMLDSEHIIHASSKVRIDRIDNTGIYNDELKKYTHKLRIVKRYI